MRLYLVQHGDAVSENVDPQKPLSEKGKDDCRKVANLADKAGVRVSAIYHSDKTRAAESAEIYRLLLGEGGDIEHKEGLHPNDDVEGWAEAADAMESDTMLVGHMPFMDRLAAKLVNKDPDKKFINFRRGGLVCLEKEGPGPWYLGFAIPPELA